MSSLDILLDTPVRWTQAATDADTRAFLDDLQANILKGHGRHHSAHLFMNFQGLDPDQTAGIVRALGQACTSAYEQLRANKRLPPFLDGGPVRCLFLSASGYQALGPNVEIPPGEAFRAGMADRGTDLGDPDRCEWDPQGWAATQPDAMFLVANADQAAVDADIDAIKAWLAMTGVNVLAVERGLQQTRNFRPDVAEGVEHFGYVDGRSQPLFLQEDIDEEALSTGGWDFRFKPAQFLVTDPNGQGTMSAGSYFVFRKLEQNVRGFNAAEDALGRTLFDIDPEADESDLTDEQKVQLDRAGAMVVGRFEDGTPLVLSDHEAGLAPPNNFDYVGDPDAAKCPFHAHIRKVNPRGDIERITGATDLEPGRRPIMARRGITYGALRPHSADLSEFADAGNEPEKDVGLLFMAYMASIENQFEFTQKSWANNKAFVANIVPSQMRPSTGIDPIIGQTADAASQQHTWLDGHTAGAQPQTIGFDSFVTMKGGEYFFAPSLTFLRGVGL
jgi:Dyp-type peroxidase family